MLNQVVLVGRVKVMRMDKDERGLNLSLIIKDTKGDESTISNIIVEGLLGNGLSKIIVQGLIEGDPSKHMSRGDLIEIKGHLVGNNNINEIVVEKITFLSQTKKEN